MEAVAVDGAELCEAADVEFLLPDNQKVKKEKRKKEKCVIEKAWLKMGDGRDSREGGYDISRSDPSAFKLQRLDSSRGNYPQHLNKRFHLFLDSFSGR